MSAGARAADAAAEEEEIQLTRGPSGKDREGRGRRTGPGEDGLSWVGWWAAAGWKRLHGHTVTL